MKTKKISKAIEMVTGAREDIKNHWSGNTDAREAADHQLYLALDYLKKFKEEHEEDCLWHEEDQLQESISNARTTIGTFFDDLREIYEPKEGNTTP
tara:strand:- start:331 stop:618 length:288 start_codon:yes stop_codon:yes gene_type:complete